MKWRDLPPVEQTPARPERLSQSLLARGDECLRAAYLDLVYNGGSSSHAMDRGTAVHLVSQRILHDLIDRGEETLYAAQPGEDPVIAKRNVASLTAAIVDEVARDHPELSLRAADWDVVRLTAYHLAVGNLVRPERVCAIERKFLLRLGGAVISGRMDVVEFDGDTAIISDVKSQLSIPDQESFTERFQGRLYAVLFCFGSPVEKMPDGNGEVVEVERPPLGRHVNRVVVRETYPRYLRDDGLIQYREQTLTRTEVNDFRVDVERLVARFNHAFESGQWQAVPGSHCSRCPAWSECPLPEALRGPEPVDESDVEGLAVKWLFLDGEAKALKRRLKVWADVNGSIPCGRDYVMEIREQANPNSSTGRSFRFGKFRVHPGEQGGSDDA